MPTTESQNARGEGNPFKPKTKFTRKEYQAKRNYLPRSHSWKSWIVMLPTNMT